MSTYEAATMPSARSERVQSEPEPAAVARLRARAQFVRLGNRYALASLGSGYIYLVAKGVVGLEAGTVGSDVRVITALYYPGDILVPELQVSLPGLSLISQRSAEFWKLTQAAFTDEIMRDSQLWQAIFARLNEQNARMQLHSAAMSVLNSEERVAAFLVEVGVRLGVHSAETVAFELPLSRYSIADYLSLNADTISRTFSALTAARIIERRGRFQIVVRDWHALIEKCPISDVILKMHGRGRPSLLR
ncbi:MAG: Crp/Fnr family transcriptional regulator [Proteobacteria bacterium]|nr:Crp/Fnr family transcriptional regulator [Pseudomonadota bacterium]